MERETVVYAGLLQLAHLVLGGGKQARTVIGLKYLARMLGKSYGHTLETALCGNGFEFLQQVYVTQMDSVKESYRGGVSASVRNGYGHEFMFWTTKVVKIDVVWEFFVPKLC